MGPKFNKENNKRKREEAHITQEVKEEEKKQKKEDPSDLYYDWDKLLHMSSLKLWVS